MGQDFFDIIKAETTDTGYAYTVELNPSHPVYEGHFPGMPVVPGVCTMDIVKKCVSGSLARKLRFGSVRECKFLAAIIPAQHKRLEINLRVTPSDSSWYISGEVAAEERIMMKIKASLV